MQTQRVCPAGAFRAAELLRLRFSDAFPLRVIDQPISVVNASLQLLADSLDSPRTVVRNMARKIFEVMTDEFENRVRKTATKIESARIA